MRRYKGVFVVYVVLVLTIVSLVSARIFFESRKNFDKGMESLEEKDLAMAIIHFGRAAKWYFPGNPYAGDALEALWGCAQTAEAKGDLGVALQACFTLRGSLYGVKGLFMPHNEWLEPCNQMITELISRHYPHTDRETVFSSLQRQVGPRPGWALAAVLGFWGWVGSVLGFIWLSFAPTGGMAWKKATFWGGLALGLFILWVFSMTRA